MKNLIQQAREIGIVTQSVFDPYRTDSKLPRLIESVLFVPSEDSSGLSLADFCSHSVWLKFERDHHKRYDQIYPLFDNDKGIVYGLKIWPPP